jgi:class 3 adenylate cyclase
MVTILCCGLAEAPARVMPEEPDVRYHQWRELRLLAQDAVQGYGGTLQPVVGECIIAVFGAPAAQEDHAQRAVLAALELQRRVRDADLDGKGQHRDRLRPRIGLRTGQVAVGGSAMARR